MIECNEAEQRIVLKLVYYGPAMSGKTTNLLRLHDLLSREDRGDLMVLDTVDDRTIYFDLLPFFLIAPSGLKIKLKVYTVPGQVKHDATRKAVLQRVDGVVFVADSQLGEQANNSVSFANLEQNLSLVGIDIDRIPVVIQFNKRDLQEILTVEEISRIWGSTRFPIVFSSALKGEGVLETFAAIAERVYEHLDSRLSFSAAHGLSSGSFIEKLCAPAEKDAKRS